MNNVGAIKAFAAGEEVFDVPRSNEHHTSFDELEAHGDDRCGLEDCPICSNDKEGE